MSHENQSHGLDEILEPLTQLCIVKPCSLELWNPDLYYLVYMAWLLTVLGQKISRCGRLRRGEELDPVCDTSLRQPWALWSPISKEGRDCCEGVAASIEEETSLRCVSSRERRRIRTLLRQIWLKGEILRGRDILSETLLDKTNSQSGIDTLWCQLEINKKGHSILLRA